MFSQTDVKIWGTFFTMNIKCIADQCIVMTKQRGAIHPAFIVVSPPLRQIHRKQQTKTINKAFQLKWQDILLITTFFFWALNNISLLFYITHLSRLSIYILLPNNQIFWNGRNFSTSLFLKLHDISTWWINIDIRSFYSIPHNTDLPTLTDTEKFCVIHKTQKFIRMFITTHYYSPS